MAKKDGRMKKKCEEYRRSGRKEFNKDLRAKKHLARIEHFKKRKDEGKTYSYLPTNNKKEKEKRAIKNIDRRLPIQKVDSLFGKLNYQLEQEALFNKNHKKKSFA